MLFLFSFLNLITSEMNLALGLVKFFFIKNLLSPIVRATQSIYIFTTIV